jgi:hypothetical protein
MALSTTTIEQYKSELIYITRKSKDCKTCLELLTSELATNQDTTLGIAVVAVTAYVKKLEFAYTAKAKEVQQILAMLPASSKDIENMACDPPICGTIQKNDIRGSGKSNPSFATYVNLKGIFT